MKVNAIADNTIFIHIAVVACQICEITQNSPKIWTYSSSRSSKVINLGVTESSHTKSY